MRIGFREIVVLLFACTVSHVAMAVEWGGVKGGPGGFFALQQQARKHGDIRVIVKLKTPKAVMHNRKGWQSLSNYIEDVQISAIKELGWVNFNRSGEV